MRYRKMSIKIMAALLAIVMVLTIMPISVITVAAAAEAQLTINNVSTVPGETVELIATLENAPVVKSMAISNITYDTSKVALTDVEWLCDAEIKNWNSAQGRGVLTFGENTEANGPVLKMTFRISDVVEDSDVAISCSIILKAMDDYGDEVPVATAVIPGKVEIRNEIQGDMDSNEKVNSDDAVYLLYHTLFGKEEYPIKQSGDIDGNGKTNSDDAVYLLYYVLFGEEEYPLYGICEHTDMAATEAKIPSCTEEGNIAYWYCADCAKYFSNAEATNEIAYIDTVISATDHTTVVDEAVAPSYTQTGLTEGSHCGVCGEVIMAQETVPMLQATYHAITYYNLQGAESPTITQYAEHEGLAFEDVPEPVRLGYTFLGWYDASSEDGKKVDKIEAGSTKDVSVYAHWEPIPFMITYKDAAVHSNEDEYTIEDEILLKDAEWSGLVFSHWSDENGNEIAKIDKGTVGNRVITANWISEKNLAIPSSNSKAQHIIYDNELNRYYFIYETGRIENVVISSLGTDDKNAGEELKWILSDTVTVENNIADTVARTVSNSFQQTDEWSKNYEWITKESSSLSNTITAGLEVEEVGVKAKIEAAIGVEDSTEATESRGYGIAGTITGGVESSDSISSTVSYTKGISTTITKEVTIPGNMPKGKYSYVCAGTVRVYAILTYDAATQNYYFDTYSVLDDELYEKRMYEAPANTTANIQSSEGLAFTFDSEEITNLIDSLYFVQYEANGGEGKMLSSAFRVLENGSLLPNEFVRNGYVFTGWSTTPNGSVEYRDNATVSAIAQSKEVVRLYAVWEVDPYSIGQYVATGSVVADSDNSDSYTVYNTIASTPVSTSGRVIVDWCNETDTDLLNHTDRSVNDGRYNNIDITDSTEEIVFIGDPNKTYTNFMMHIYGFDNGQKLVIRFVNFNFVTNEDTAIDLLEDGGVDLTIDVIGSCSIRTSYAGGSIIGSTDATIKNLTFTDSADSGTMSITAGNGAEGSSANADGGNGGVAVYADMLSVNMDNTLTVTGGNGGNGLTGTDGATAGADGVDGGNGGNGGAAIVGAVNIKAGNAIISSGNGGNGGDGGDGKTGTTGKSVVNITVGKDGNKNYGGKGGDGGNGGNGGVSNLVIIGSLDDVNNCATLVKGICGDGGDGGSGGDGGKGGDYYNVLGSVWRCGGGSGGDGGDGGSGRTAGLGGTAGSKGGSGTSNPVAGIGLGINYGSIFYDNGNNATAGIPGEDGETITEIDAVGNP